MRWRAPIAFAWAMLLLGACDDDEPDGVLPAVVFVSGDQQDAELYLWSGDTLTRLTSNAFAESQPHVAAGRLVFTSERDGDPEIYMGDVRATTVRRLTTDPAADEEAAIHPTGDRIVFVSTRSGTPRLWIMDTLGGSLAPVGTGSSLFIPERAPAWSPQGDRLAFTSARTGTSQVFVVSAIGGVGTQVTTEAGGAFDPAWSATGSQIIYATAAGTPRLRSVVVADGTTADYAVAGDTSLGEPSCSPDFCVVVRGAYGFEGDLVAYAAPRAAERPGGVPPRPGPIGREEPRVLVARAGNDRQPAVVPPPP
jgi:dipeptidyl aminopeptidase/acylaminoacyl peptidase